MGNPYTNDNTTYTSLGFQALLILNRLRTKLELLQLAEKQEEQRERDAEGGSADNECAHDDRAEVDQHLNKEGTTEAVPVVSGHLRGGSEARQTK